MDLSKFRDKRDEFIRGEFRNSTRDTFTAEEHRLAEIYYEACKTWGHWRNANGMPLPPWDEVDNVCQLIYNLECSVRLEYEGQGFA